MNEYLLREILGLNFNTERNNFSTLLEQFMENYANCGWHPEVLSTGVFGNVNLHRPVVTISLNPKFDKGADYINNYTLLQQSNLNGFAGSYFYEDDKKLHNVWKNLAKVLFSEGERLNNSLKQLLQDNVVNIDYFPVYSEKFPTLNDEILNSQLFTYLNDHMNRLIQNINPRLIFLSGKSLAPWFSSFCEENENNSMELQHGPKSYKVRSGTLTNTDIPVVYQEWFINSGNRNVNLERVRSLIVDLSE